MNNFLLETHKNKIKLENVEMSHWHFCKLYNFMFKFVDNLYECRQELYKLKEEEDENNEIEEETWKKKELTNATMAKLLEEFEDCYNKTFDHYLEIKYSLSSLSESISKVADLIDPNPNIEF